MKIVIAGAGRVGQQLAKELVKHDHDLIVFEKDKVKADHVSEILDIAVIHADASDIVAFKEAVGDGADTLIAVTESDELNLTLCALTRKLSVNRRIARIRNESWFTESGLTPAAFGIDDVIHPEKETVNYIEKVISVDEVFDYAEFASGEIVLMGFNVASDLPVVDMTLAQVRERFALDYFLIIGIYRDTAFFVPDGSDTIMVGDKLWLLTAKETVPFFLSVFRREERARRDRALILGATRIGLRTAEMLGDRFGKVILVEQEGRQARAAGERLPGTQVLCADIHDKPELLNDFDPASLDCFVAASDDSRVNIMSSLLAKRLGARKVIAVTEESGYMPVMNAIGLDIVVNPHHLTAGAILRHLKKGIVHSVVELMAGEAEIIEYDIVQSSKVTGVPLAKIGFPKGAVVGMTIHEDTATIPSGSTVLNEGDRVIVVATSDMIPVIEKLFAPKSSFFS